MQRFAQTNLSAEQAATVAAELHSVSLQPVAELSVCIEVASPSGEVLERAPGHARIAFPHRDGDVAPAVVASAEARPSPSGGGITLYHTSAVDAEHLAEELSKMLSREAPANKLLLLTYSHDVCSGWNQCSSCFALRAQN